MNTTPTARSASALRRWMAPAMLLATLGFAATGCSYNVDVISSGSNEVKALPAVKKKLPTRVVLKPGGGASVGDDMKARLEQTGLFEEVIDLAHGGGAYDPRPNEVFARVKLQSSPEYDSGFPGRAVLTGVLNAVFPVLAFVVMAPFNVVYVPGWNYEIGVEMVVEGSDGREIWRSDTKQTIDVSTQAFASDDDITRDAKATALDAGEQVLIARLVQDPEAHEAIMASVKSAGSQPAPRAAPPRTAPTPRPPVPAPLPGDGRTFVLAIGINGYTDSAIPSLQFAENDARAVYGFYATDARSPTDTDRVHLMLGTTATRREVLKAVREHLIQKAVRPDDTVILFFAGHGFADTNDTYLACADTDLASLPETAISRGVLDSYWGRIGAGRKVMITDACHSGGLAGTRGIGGVSRADNPLAATVTVTATGANQLSIENDKIGHGIFTNALLNGLRGNADSDRDGHVTVGEMKRYLHEEVDREARGMGQTQTPVVEVPGGMENHPMTKKQ